MKIAYLILCHKIPCSLKLLSMHMLIKKYFARKFDITQDEEILSVLKEKIHQKD